MTDTKPCEFELCACFCIRREGESAGEWRQRRFCSLSCANRHEAGARRHSNWKDFPAPLGDKAFQAALVAAYGERAA